MASSQSACLQFGCSNEELTCHGQGRRVGDEVGAGGAVYIRTNSKKRKRDGLSPDLGDDTATTASVMTIVGQKDDAQAGRATKRVKGKRGFLQRIADMPLELLFEIFGQLDPMDVLNLARTSRPLRAILLQKSSIDIWKATLENVVGLPRRPEDLNEPQWVDLLYGRNCQLCGRAAPLTTQTYAWEARVRGCFKCVTGEFTEQDLVFPYIPSTDDISQLVADITPSFEVDRNSRGVEEGTHYHTTTFYEHFATYKAFTDAEERTGWLEEKQDAKTALEEHAYECERWISELRQVREAEREEMRTDRKSVLRARLEGLGYTPPIVEVAFGTSDFWKIACVSSILQQFAEHRARIDFLISFSRARKTRLEF